MKIIFATHNEGKVTEMRQLLRDLNIKVMSAEEAGVTEDVVEDGKTFKENAFKKAEFAAKKTREWAVADDSGICIEALDGRPGVNSARWSGGKGLADYTLEKMKNIPEGKRSASWFCTLALVDSNYRHYFFEGRVNGVIAFEKRGKAKPNLPYDLIFIPRGYERTFAEMSDEEKNRMSHRGRAFDKLRIFLKKELRL